MAINGLWFFQRMVYNLILLSSGKPYKSFWVGNDRSTGRDASPNTCNFVNSGKNCILTLGTSSISFWLASMNFSSFFLCSSISFSYSFATFCEFGTPYSWYYFQTCLSSSRSTLNCSFFITGMQSKYSDAPCLRYPNGFSSELRFSSILLLSFKTLSPNATASLSNAALKTSTNSS